MTNVQLGEIMSRPVVGVAPATTARALLDLARESGHHHFPVLRSSGVAGMVCTCDLREAALTTPVKEVMKAAVAVMTRTDTARDAASLMVRRCVGSVLVLEDARLYGIVTREDLLRADPLAAARIRACKCQYCGSFEHLQLERRGTYCCVDCAERRDEPGAFEGGGG